MLYRALETSTENYRSLWKLCTALKKSGEYREINSLYCTKKLSGMFRQNIVNNGIDGEALH